MQLATPYWRSVAAPSLAATMALPGVLVGNMHGMCVTCCAVVNESTIAVGHDYGVFIYGPAEMKPVWLNARVNSVAYVGNDCIWRSTNQQKAFA